MRALALLAAAATFPAFADCTPPQDEVTIECDSCGNLEQNLERGFDLAWNELLDNKGMREELALTGSTEVVLANPPHSSDGVLWYRVNVTDSTWEIANSREYSRLARLVNERSLGFQGSIGGLGRSFGAEVRWATRIEQQISQAISTAIKTTARPLTLILEDQSGNEIGREDVERNAGEQDPGLAGPKDLFPDNKRKRPDCAGADDRIAPTERTRPGGGQQERPPSACSYTSSTRCRGDFSRPNDTGIVCSTNIETRC